MVAAVSAGAVDEKSQPQKRGIFGENGGLNLGAQQQQTGVIFPAPQANYASQFPQEQFATGGFEAGNNQLLGAAPFAGGSYYNGPGPAAVEVRAQPAPIQFIPQQQNIQFAAQQPAFLGSAPGAYPIGQQSSAFLAGPAPQQFLQYAQSAPQQFLQYAQSAPQQFLQSAPAQFIQQAPQQIHEIRVPYPVERRVPVERRGK